MSSVGIYTLLPIEIDVTSNPTMYIYYPIDLYIYQYCWISFRVDGTAHICRMDGISENIHYVIQFGKMTPKGFRNAIIYNQWGKIIETNHRIHTGTDTFDVQNCKFNELWYIKWQSEYIIEKALLVVVVVDFCFVGFVTEFMMVTCCSRIYIRQKKNRRFSKIFTN